MIALAAFATREALMAAAAHRIADAVTQAITIRGAACIALSGGSTPEPAYRLLAAIDLDWRRIMFALVDERCVPTDHEASNEGTLRRALAPALSNGATLIPMYADAPTPAGAALLAEARYAPLHFDIALLGMGIDGHTASWVPGAAGLAEALDPASTRTVVALSAPRAAGAATRLSLTRAALARAERLVLLITGEDKRARLEQALQSSPEAAPVAALFIPPAPRPDILWAP
jgi:6-phosphogluconolactonase